LRKALKPYGVTIHSLRHTYAYLLKSKGVHVTTAQKLLGHSDPKITLAVYTRVLDSEIDDVGNVLTLVSKRAHSSEMREQIQKESRLGLWLASPLKSLNYAGLAA
jgi:site-specific recombinase XerC